MHSSVQGIPYRFQTTTELGNLCSAHKCNFSPLLGLGLPDRPLSGSWGFMNFVLNILRSLIVQSHGLLVQGGMELIKWSCIRGDDG